MVAVAIFSADPVLRRNLEQLPRDDPAVVIVGMVDQLSAVRELVNRDRVDVLVADVPPELLPVYRSGHTIALVVLLGGANVEDTARALSAGARAVLDRSASRNEIIAAIKVLAAMADGASNKAIARRLGISFHTAKFHVAAILAKLDADSRTEAVAKALVML
jgi:DNA-binding NarL/FixJ family response regulator